MGQRGVTRTIYTHFDSGGKIRFGNHYRNWGIQTELPSIPLYYGQNTLYLRRSPEKGLTEALRVSARVIREKSLEAS